MGGDRGGMFGDEGRRAGASVSGYIREVGATFFFLNRRLEAWSHMVLYWRIAWASVLKRSDVAKFSHEEQQSAMEADHGRQF